MKVKIFNFIFFLMMTVPGWGSIINADSNTTEGKAKVLNVFNIIQFPNSGCNSTITNVYGVCYTTAECVRLSGTSSGTCASGFGVCCTFANDCNTETSQNGTYFSNPISLSSVCSLMIRTMDESICQVRLKSQ